MARITRVRPFNYILTPKAGNWIKKSFNYRFNVLEGAVRSGKDYTAAVSFVERIKISESSLFLIGAVNMTRAKQIVGQYILDYCGGLAKRAFYEGGDAIEFNWRGKINTIIFADGYTQTSHERIQGLTLGGVYLTEGNLLHPNFIAQTMNRILASPNPFIFITVNPKGPRHWFYREYLDLWSAENTFRKNWLNYEHMTMYDNPAMTEDMIEAAMYGRDPNSASYKRDILGLRVDPENNLFTITDEKNILQSFKYSDYPRYIVVADFGRSISSTTFLLAGLRIINGQWEIHILDSYHHLNKDVGQFQKKEEPEYAKDYATFILKGIENFNGRYPTITMYDGEQSTFRNIDKALKTMRLGSISPKYVDKEKSEERIKRQQSLFYLGQIKIYKELVHVIHDIKDAELDRDKYEKTGVITRLDVFDEYGHGDSLDCIDYISTYVKNSGLIL